MKNNTVTLSRFSLICNPGKGVGMLLYAVIDFCPLSLSSMLIVLTLRGLLLGLSIGKMLGGEGIYGLKKGSEGSKVSYSQCEAKRWFIVNSKFNMFMKSTTKLNFLYIVYDVLYSIIDLMSRLNL